jgi:hypothetical protein
MRAVFLDEELLVTIQSAGVARSSVPWRCVICTSCRQDGKVARYLQGSIGIMNEQPGSGGKRLDTEPLGAEATLAGLGIVDIGHSPLTIYNPRNSAS